MCVECGLLTAARELTIDFLPSGRRAPHCAFARCAFVGAALGASRDPEEE